MKLQRNPNVLATEQGDELILLNPQTGKYFGANGSGAVIWALIESPLSVEEITKKIVANYSGDEAAINEMVRKFLGELRQRELVNEIL